jgi:hypothetical protein
LQSLCFHWRIAACGSQKLTSAAVASANIGITWWWRGPVHGQWPPRPWQRGSGLPTAHEMIGQSTAILLPGPNTPLRTKHETQRNPSTRAAK